ncbi:hypothetical protein Q9L58_008628 [Maublancomyces gigas]|uniref:Uncharacterized protein n=1 Tax=Discina gigas TaxID=1032678 RepID=A0ABR3G953_9PEZI
MATGGFRDVATLSSGRRPRSMTMSDLDEEDLKDIEMNAGTSLLEEDEHYFEDEITPQKLEKQYSRSPSPSNSVRSMSGVTPLSIPSKGKPRKLKSILKSLKEDRTILLSRPRVIFRVFSLVASGVVLGSSGHMLFHYLDTRAMPAHGGGFLWNQNIELTPTNILLAVSAIVAALALLHSILSLVGGIVALGLSEEKRNPNSMFWVCGVLHQDPIDLAVMDFNIHCSEQRGTWFAACIYTVAHGLIIPTIILGFISCGAVRKRPTFKDAVIVRVDTGKSGIFQRLGNLKEKFSHSK